MENQENLVKSTEKQESLRKTWENIKNTRKLLETENSDPSRPQD